MWYLIVFVLGFAGGWAFFKHRATIKAKATEEMKQAAQAVKNKL